MKKISRDTLFVGYIGTVVVIANAWHVLIQWAVHKPGEIFTGIAHYFIDYFFYISHIVQGSNGAWFFTKHMYTNELLTPTWIYWFYTMLGKMSAIGVNPFVVYNASIVVLCALLLAVWWYVIRAVLPKRPLSQLIAFLFLSTASNFPDLGAFWFSPTPALNRLGGVPHQIFQSILLLLVLIFLTKAIPSDNHHSRFMRSACLVLLTVISFVAATASPIQMLLIVASAGIYVAIIELRSHKILPYLIPVILTALPALLGAYLTNTEFARQQVLVVAKQWENSQNVSVSLWLFVLAVGPISLCIPFGIKQYVHKISPLGMLLGIFSVLSVAVFFSPLPKLMGTASVRWLSPASYGALPILAALGLHEISLIIRRFATPKTPTLGITFVLLILYLLLTIPSLTDQIQARLNPLQSDRIIRSLNHIPTPMMEAFAAIAHDSDTGVVLTDPTLTYDTVIPVFTGKQSFTGQPVHTLYPQVKEQLRIRFFEGAMSEPEARQFVTDHNIRYILAASRNTRTRRSHAFMKQIFQNDAATVFTTGQK